MKTDWLKHIIFISVTFCFTLLYTGCSTKTVGASDSSAKIINSYVNKELPIGWKYNFGIGSSYGYAVEDANKTKTMENLGKVEATAYHYGGGNYVKIKDTTMFGITNFCEVKETWDVPEGILIIRLCPDVSYFQEGYLQTIKDHDIDKNVKYSVELGKVLSYIEQKQKLALQSKSREDIRYLESFKVEFREMDRNIVAANFYEDDSETIIFWLETSYKDWFNKLEEFKDSQLKKHYGIMYPYQYCSNIQYKLGYMPNQFWKIKSTNLLISRRYKLSDVQLVGLTQKPDSMWFEYIDKR